MNFKLSYSVQSRLRLFFNRRVLERIRHCTIVKYTSTTSTFTELKTNLSNSALYTHPKENFFCHSVLEDGVQYSVINFSQIESKIFNQNIPLSSEDLSLVKYEELSAEELNDLYKSVTINAATKTFLPLSNELYNKLINEICEKIKYFSDDQIANFLTYSSVWPLSDYATKGNFYKLWKALDDECCVRWRDWDMVKCFYFIDLWFLLKLTRLSNFVFHSINYLGKKSSRLTSSQLVQLMFYLSVLRTAHKGLNMFNLESRLEECSRRLTIEEMGVALLGFFKTQTRIQNQELLKYIINRTISESDNIPEISLAAILKCLRLSMNIPVWSELVRLLDGITPHLHKYSIQACIHAALITAPSQTLHPPSLNIVSQKLLDNLSTARIKDIEKVLLPISQVNYNPKTTSCIYSAVLEELRKPSRQHEIELFPKSFVALIHYLTLREIFPLDIIAKILDMEFVVHTYGKKKFMFQRELLCLDTRVEVECKDYTGPRLPTDIRNYLSKRYSAFLPDERRIVTSYDSFTNSVKTTADSVLGKECTDFKYVLPDNSRADIVYQVDSISRVVALPEEFRAIEAFTGVVRPPDTGHQWHAIIPAAKNMMTFNERTLNGETVCKLRCLRLLGYTPHVISIHDWPIGGTEADKEDYLKMKISF